MRTPPINLLERLAAMDFTHRLTNLRKARGLTQQTLADTLCMHLAALDQLDPDERATIRALIEGALLRHQARRLSAS